MPENISLWKKKATQLCRLGAQFIVMRFTIAGYNHLVDIDILPGSVFVLSVVFFGMFFCGWACPFGAAQEWVRVLGVRMTGITLNIPNPLHRYLALSRYVLWLSVFVIAWDPTTAPINSRRAFLSFFAGGNSAYAAVIFLSVMLAVSLFMDRPYCKYLCRRGAGRGIVGMARPFTVIRNQSRCVGCGKCDRICQMGIEISTAGNLRTANCINCFKCVAGCPAHGALKFGFAIPKLKDLKDAVRRYFTLNPRNE